MIFVQPKIKASFDICHALLHSEMKKISMASETIHRHDRFNSTCVHWKYVCPGSRKYWKSRRRKSRRRKSVKSCYSTKPLIPFISSCALWFSVLMASHHHDVMEYCWLYFLTHAFSRVQIFNLKHNDSWFFQVPSTTTTYSLAFEIDGSVGSFHSLCLLYRCKK